MTTHADSIKDLLDSILNEVSSDPSDFLVNPDKDFTRKRGFSFSDIIRLILSMGSQNLSSEILEYFSYDAQTPSVSAFIQQRQKILPDAFSYIFSRFNELTDKAPNLYDGYRI